MTIRSLVQDAVSALSPAGTTSVSLPSLPSVGDALGLIVGALNAPPSVALVSGGGVPSWTKIATHSVGGLVQAEGWVGLTSGGGRTVTIIHALGLVGGAALGEISGVADPTLVAVSFETPGVSLPSFVGMPILTALDPGLRLRFSSWDGGGDISF